MAEATASAVATDVPQYYSWVRTVPRTAGLARRLVAFIVDGLVIIIATYVVTFVLTTLGVLDLPTVNLAGGSTDEAVGFLWLVSLLELPVNLVYFTLLEGRNGRSLGKLMMGLRVVTLTGRPISMFDAFLRGLLRLLWMTPVGVAFLLLDAYIIHVTELDQRIGDLAAATIVVEEKARKA